MVKKKQSFVHSSGRPRETHTYKYANQETDIRIITAAHQTRNNPNVSCRINIQCYRVRRTEYCIMRIKELQLHKTAWMDLTNMLGERSHTYIKCITSI